MVVCSHTWFDLFGRRLNWSGAYAVFGFYVLSGYLMTRVLHETYGYGPRSCIRFLGNRVLRIYPAYWVAMALMAAYLVLEPPAPDPTSWASLIPGHHLPDRVGAWIRGVTLLFLDWDYRPNMLPPTWSLHVELVFYGILALGLSRTVVSTLVWLSASVAWTLVALLVPVPFPERYATVIGASLPFAAGALIHFLPGLPTRARWGLLAGASFFVNLFVPGMLGDSPTGRWFYVSLALAIVVTATLRDVRAAPGWRRIDSALGDLAYPVFLVHPPVSYALLWLFPAAFETSREWFLVSMAAVVLVAAVLHLAVVRPIEGARSRVRGRPVRPA